MLQVKDLQVYYGVINAIKGVSFEVNEGEVIALIGANGAGKTTILHTITGLVAPKAGSVIFEGKNLVRTPAHKIVGLGMAHVPEGRRVFAHLSVYDNLMLGAFSLNSRAKIDDNLRYVYSHFPRLEERKNQIAGTLSGGEQQMLAISRGLMSNPKLLMLDEPSLGLAPIIVEEIFNMIEKVRKAGTTVLLIEQNASIALQISDYAYAIELGRISLSGTGQELLNSEDVKRVYLGM